MKHKIWWFLAGIVCLLFAVEAIPAPSPTIYVPWPAVIGTNEIQVNTSAATSKMRIGPATPISQIASNAAQNVVNASAVWTNDGSITYPIVQQAVYIQSEKGLWIGDSNALRNLLGSWTSSGQTISSVLSGDSGHQYNGFTFGYANSGTNVYIQATSSSGDPHMDFLMYVNTNNVGHNYDLDIDLNRSLIGLSSTDSQSRFVIANGDAFSTGNMLLATLRGILKMALGTNGSLFIAGTITNTALSPSKLVATGTGTNLTSSAYGDSDIAGWLATSNSFVKIQNGTANALIETNSTLIGAVARPATGATTPAFAVGNTNLSSTNLYVGTNGNVGINTNAPSVPLEVTGPSGTANILTVTSNGNPIVHIAPYGIRVRTPSSNPSIPEIASISGTNTGISFNTSAPNITFLVNSAQAAMVDATGFGVLSGGAFTFVNNSSTINANPGTKIVSPRLGSVIVSNAVALTAYSLGGTICVSNNPIASAGASQTNLITFTVKANTLTNNGDRIKARWSGRFGATANTKDLFVIFGSETILDTSAQIVNSGAWTVEAEIIRTGNTSQAASAEFHGAGVTLFTTAAAVDLVQTNGIATVLKMMSTAAGDGDVTNRTMTVEFYPAP